MKKRSSKSNFYVSSGDLVSLQRRSITPSKMIEQNETLDIKNVEELYCEGEVLSTT